MENAMLERIRTLAVEMKPGMLDLAQRIIRCPSLTGEEKGVADILLDELNKLGYDDVFRGNADVILLVIIDQLLAVAQISLRW